MTLPEAFEKYDDSVMLRRKSFWKECVTNGILTQDQLNEALKEGIGANNIGYLKSSYPWMNIEYRKIGLIIPQFMIEDANADDWEVYEPNK